MRAAFFGGENSRRITLTSSYFLVGSAAGFVHRAMSACITALVPEQEVKRSMGALEVGKGERTLRALIRTRA